MECQLRGKARRLAVIFRRGEDITGRNELKGGEEKEARVKRGEIIASTRRTVLLRKKKRRNWSNMGD